MLIYDNGKSAIKVGNGGKPRDVHRWALPAEYSDRYGTGICDPRNLNMRFFQPNCAACILHYGILNYH